MGNHPEEPAQSQQTAGSDSRSTCYSNHTRPVMRDRAGTQDTELSTDTGASTNDSIKHGLTTSLTTILGTDHLQPNQNHAIYLEHDTKRILGEALDPNNLNLTAMSIGHDKGQQVKMARHSVNPLYQTPHAFYSASNHRSSLSYDAIRENPASSYSTPTVARANFAGHRKPQAWVSFETQVHQDFLVVRNSMRRLFKNSEVAKWKLNDYIAHRENIAAAEANRANHRTITEPFEPYRAHPISREIQERLCEWNLVGNWDQTGNLGRVLGEPTIWCTEWTIGKDDVAPWPSMAEMKWEGDDRANTKVGRFLPLPREQGPSGLPWSQLQVLEQYPMDQICKVPTMEDVYLPIDTYIELDKQYLWSMSLEMDIDAFLAS